MAGLKDIVFDSRHPASIARFWSSALNEYQIAPYDEVELARLREMGVEDPEDDPTVLLVRIDGLGPRIFFQKVPEGKSAKNRLHLDLEAEDPDAEIARLLALGASVSADHGNLVTMLDPEENEFCVLRTC